MQTSPGTAAPGPRPTAAVLLCTTLLATAGCASAGRLGEYDFAGRTVAVVAEVPPRPFVHTGADDLTGLSAEQLVLKVGAGIYKESRAERLRAHLDSAGDRVDVAERISGILRERAARILGARATDDPAGADFLLEVRVDELGVAATEWDRIAHFRLEARLLLVDQEGREVWKGDMAADDELSEIGFTPGSPADDVWTGRALGRLTVEEAARTFESLADHAGHLLADKLRAGMEKARGG